MYMYLYMNTYLYMYIIYKFNDKTFKIAYISLLTNLLVSVEDL